MKTLHRYIDFYPIPPDSKKLILGTIHPHFHESFQVDFFYGNRNSIWNILNEAFPGELGQPITKESILAFLHKHQIAISDTIRECTRTSNAALDQDLIPDKLNDQLIEQIKHSQISEILFTSGFGKNNAFKLFYENLLGLRINEAIRQQRGTVTPKEIFGRPVKLTVLYSPSGAANVGLSKSQAYLEQRAQFAGSTRPVHDFKVSHYREKFLS